MTLKLIATDMDGTLLTDAEKTFDHEYFGRLLTRMEKLDVKFVVASGNQFPKLLQYMQDFLGRNILYVAENGGYIAREDRDILISAFSPETVAAVVKVLDQFPDLGFIISAHEGAFLIRDRAEPITRIVREHMEFLGAEVPRELDYISFINRFYPGTQVIESLDEMGDASVVKFALQTHRRDIENILKQLVDLLPSNVVPVASGFGAIDLVSRGVNKGSALKWVGQELGIKPEEMIAFGDNSNDLEMLQYVGEGIAVENAAPHVKAVADTVIGTNEDGAVLKYIEVKLDQLESAQQ
ncbi:HAD family hydrolase [Rothia amarae]|uniref:Cof-type HAD-IIB family hydrolase n=1 Tax=Rothia amarae TaxID=169480 RepID=UPI0031D13C2B